MAHDDSATTRRTYTDWIGSDAYDRSGDKIGEIEQVYLDNETGRPEWLAITTGWFGTNSSFAPIVGSSEHEGGLRVDVDKDAVKHAPNVGTDARLSADEERRLYEHYHIDPTGGRDAYVAEQRTKQGYDTGRRFDQDYDVDEAVLVRREDEAQPGTHRQEAGNLRLRRYVVTER